MLHLLDQTNKKHNNDGYENVRHEENHPASVVWTDSGDFEEHPTANQIRVEEEKFHQQDQEDELQCASIIRFDSNFFKLFIYLRHQVKP